MFPGGAPRGQCKSLGNSKGWPTAAHVKSESINKHAVSQGLGSSLDSPPARGPWRAAAWQHQYHGTGICIAATTITTTTITNLAFIIATTIILTIVICHSLSYPVAPCHSLSYPVAPCRSLSFPAVLSLFRAIRFRGRLWDLPNSPESPPPFKIGFFSAFILRPY